MAMAEELPSLSILTLPPCLLKVSQGSFTPDILLHPIPPFHWRSSSNIPSLYLTHNLYTLLAYSRFLKDPSPLSLAYSCTLSLHFTGGHPLTFSPSISLTFIQSLFLLRFHSFITLSSPVSRYCSCPVLSNPNIVFSPCSFVLPVILFLPLYFFYLCSCSLSLKFLSVTLVLAPHQPTFLLRPQDATKTSSANK